MKKFENKWNVYYQLTDLVTGKPKSRTPMYMIWNGSKKEAESKCLKFLEKKHEGKALVQLTKTEASEGFYV